MDARKKRVSGWFDIVPMERRRLFVAVEFYDDGSRVFAYRDDGADLDDKFRTALFSEFA